MRFRLTSRFPLALAAILTATCGPGGSLLPPCERVRAQLTARTVDGAATIAAVTITGSCYLGSTCHPSATTPCATVLILGSPGSPCSLTFMSPDGRSVSATASVVVTGPTYRCRDDSGMIYNVGYGHFEPAEIVVDFSTAPPADAGVD